VIDGADMSIITRHTPPDLQMHPRSRARLVGQSSASQECETSDDSAELVFVLVIAHPDDESMFFLPTVVSIRKSLPDAKLWIMCLTRGNYDDLGSVRCQELQKVCDLLGVDELIQVDRPEMQDHPSRPWSIPDAARAIEAILADALKKADLGEACLIHLITFDEGGVSGHVNHRDCYRSVRNLLAPASLANPSKRVVGMHLWTLETVRNPIRKYLPFIEWIILILTWIRRIPVSSKMNPEAHCFAADVTSLTLRLSDPALNWKAMSMHASQFVWYRRLFVVFSCYTYVNRLQRVARQSFGGGGIRKGR
jgi:N-acetylglucosaminylphosphatidylinositol deacetylase